MGNTIKEKVVANYGKEIAKNDIIKIYYGKDSALAKDNPYFGLFCGWAYRGSRMAIITFKVLYVNGFKKPKLSNPHFVTVEPSELEKIVKLTNVNITLKKWNELLEESI